MNIFATLKNKNMNEDNIRRLEHISVHYVRNKMNGEGMVLSESELELDPDMTILLKDFSLRHLSRMYITNFMMKMHWRIMQCFQ